MRPRAPAAPPDSPLFPVRAGTSDLAELSGVSGEDVASLTAATPQADGVHCVIPGCLEAHPGTADTLPGDSPACDSIGLGGTVSVQAFRADLRDKGLRRAALNTTWRLLWVGWQFLRRASGDDAYERYLDHMVHAHPGHPAMRRGEYYRFRTEQKWNRITRCC
jgi:uncharacterized short protein YbdD (DUF466 family)